MIGAFKYARMEAIKQGGNVTLNPVDLGTNWTVGISVGTTTGTLRVWPAFDAATTVSSTQSTFTFSPTGEVNNTDVLQICDDRTGEEGMQIEILVSGAIISEKITCG